MVWLLIVMLAVWLLAASVYYVCFSPNSQLFGRFPSNTTTTDKVLALTFDDGPNPPHTNELLGVLRRHAVRATFFLVGQNLERSPRVGRAIVADGHSVGNHSYAHAFSTYFSKSAFVRDVERNQAVINDLIGVRPTIFRPPWLFRLPWILQTLKSLNLAPIFGAFGSELEIFQPRAETIVRRALRKAKPGVILIFHDGYSATSGYRRRTVEAVDQLIPELKSRGYTFMTVPELLQTVRQPQSNRHQR